MPRVAKPRLAFIVIVLFLSLADTKKIRAAVKINWRLENSDDRCCAEWTLPSQWDLMIEHWCQLNGPKSPAAFNFKIYVRLSSREATSRFRRWVTTREPPEFRRTSPASWWPSSGRWESVLSTRTIWWRVPEGSDLEIFLLALSSFRQSGLHCF